MANTQNQTVVQITTSPNGKRLVVQYYDDVEQANKQVVKSYDDLTAEEKTTFDNFETLCDSIMNS